MVGTIYNILYTKTNNVVKTIINHFPNYLQWVVYYCVKHIMGFLIVWFYFKALIFFQWLQTADLQSTRAVIFSDHSVDGFTLGTRRYGYGRSQIHRCFSRCLRRNKLHPSSE